MRPPPSPTPCNSTGLARSCQAEYDAAFPNCFAPGKGVACAAACVAKKAKCAGSTTGPPANTQCTKTCQNNWIVAGSQCGGVQACYDAALAAYNACKTACTTNPTVVSCSTAFSICMTKCPNL